MKNRLFCFMPFFINRTGHEGSFLSSLVKVGKSIDKKILLILPDKNKIKFRSVKNYKILKINKFKNVIFLFLFIKNILIIKNFLRLKKINKNDKIYIDGHNLLFLLIFAIISFVFKNNLSLIIFCRYKFNGIKSTIFKLTIKYIYKNTSNLQILTDTDLIKKNYLQKFIKQVYLMPIPHTFKNTKYKKNQIKDKINLFFPGKYRNDKFSKNFKLFVKKNNSRKLRFLITKKVNFENNKKFKTLKINDNLSREDYLRYFLKSNFIILPYESKDYKYRSSGIFVESISLRKIVLVSVNTWMSKELKKHNLSELIVHDWNNFEIFKFIKNYNHQKIDKKLKIMQKKYLTFHNEKNFHLIMSRSIN